MSSMFSPQYYERRKRSERRFQRYGKCGLGFALLMLVLLLGNVLLRGVGGFLVTNVSLPITFSELRLAVTDAQALHEVPTGNYLVLVKDALTTTFPEATTKREQRELMELVSASSSSVLRNYLLQHPEALGKTVTLSLPASSQVDLTMKGATDKLNEAQNAALQKLAPTRAFNVGFFKHADSRMPEHAGFLGAVAGSLFTLLVCFLLAFPIGVAAAIYLQEFAPKGRITDIIEVNISNLAAVPSIIYGLLGLSVYINVMHLPRSAPIVGGLTLALMMLPVLIIATRAALSSVPDSIRQAALALGATPLQVVLHHTLPLAIPGIMTGTILGLSRAIGETAPLLMIGMVAFVADIPSGIADPATVMPVQIYLWATSPESGFVEKTASGILVLIALLLCMNAVAIFIRKKFEVRW